MSVFRSRGWLAALLSVAVSGASIAQDRGATALGEAIEGLGVNTRVLMIAAHPDDEDTQVISWLSRGHHVETAYLSLTRGDGGQNIIGNELGEALGVVRTEELLAARRIDGGKQFFTRAYDYGFSKSADEAFTQWSRDSLLRDVITVVRAFKPHVIISVFSGTPRDGHGQHQAAGILAREAYDLAGDTVRFPRSATREYGGWTVSKFYRGGSFRQDAASLRFNVGTYDPVIGRSYAEIAAISRSQHRSQAFGTLQPLGVRMDGITREDSRVGAPADASAERSMFDGIDTTWNRLRGKVHGPASLAALDSLPQAFADVRASFDAFAPERSIPALARLHRLVSRLCPADPREFCARPPSNSPGPPAPASGYLTGSPPGFASENEVARTRDVTLERIQNAVRLASGVAVEATVPRALWATDEEVTATITIYNRGRVPVQFIDFFSLTGTSRSHPPVGTVLPDSTVVRQVSNRHPLTRPDRWNFRPTAPWWLAQPRQGAMYAPLSIATEGLADEGSSYPGHLTRIGLSVEGVGFEVTTPIVYRYADQVRGEIRRPMAVAPAVSVLLDQEIAYAPARAPIEREVRVQLTGASSEEREVQLTIKLPAGLIADSATRTVRVPPNGRTHSVGFKVRGQLQPGRHVLDVTATLGDQVFAQGYTTIDYEHINARRIYRPSRMSIEAVDVATVSGLRVGYIQGVGDNSAAALTQLGVDVTMLDPAALAQTDLSPYTAIVVGPRAYDANPALVANNGRLLEYAEQGGTLVVQYGQYEMTRPGMTPYPLTINRPHDRVTNENAPVMLIDSTSTVLRSPNRITTADFDGWIQDRSLYMPRTFDPRYIPAVELSDPGEQPNRGGILVAPVGRGTYVYTSLAFFRQLPNGVPGAARLFLNLLSAKAQRTTP